MDGVDADGLKYLVDVLSGQHSSVGRALFSVSLDLHATADTGVGFAAGHISHVDESVVLGGLDVADTEHIILVGAVLIHVGGSVVSQSLLFLGLCPLCSLLGLKRAQD